nr:wsv311-like protein [Chionoecetes opilio bacilliform virus]
MDFSSLTGLDMVVIAGMFIASMAIIAIILLLFTIGRRIADDSKGNKEATFRVALLKAAATSKFVVTEVTYKSVFGKVAFSEAGNMHQHVDGDIVFMSTTDASASSISYVDFTVSNNTKKDIYISNARINPTMASGSVFSGTAVATVFTPFMVKASEQASSRIVGQQSTDTQGAYTLDIVIDQSGPTLV